MKHIEIVKAGKEEWNAWYFSEIQKKGRFKTNLAYAELEGFDFRGYHFFEPIFFNATLNEGIFDDLKIKGSNFKEASVENGSFLDTNLSDSILSNGVFKKSLFNQTALVSSSLNHGIFDESIFINCELNISRIQGSSFIKSTFNNTKFYGAEIKGCDFTNADIFNSDLRAAYLIRSSFLSTDIKHSIFGSTIVSTCNFNDVKNLSTIIHQGSSTIDIRTISTIKNERDTFLKEAGFRDAFITNIDSLLVNPIQFYDCFISYSTKNEAFVNKLYDDLQKRGVQCWKWDIDGKWGEVLNSEIDKAIKIHDKLILVCSKESLNSRPVLNEIDRAIEKENFNSNLNTIFPIRLDNYIFDEWDNYRKPDLTKRLIGDFSNWKNPEIYKKLLDKLEKALIK